MVKKQYDKNLKLYLDIVKELKENYKLNLYLFSSNNSCLYDFKYKNYYTFKRAKKKELELLLKNLRKTLNIISITKYVDLNA